jgi:DNA gyrase/topoisomerase IV subunit A
MVTKEGLVWSMEVDQLPVTIEAVLRLDPSDHIVTAFIIHDEQSLLVLTQNGKVLQREKSWLEPASTFKTKGQPLISKERREAGVWVSGAAPVNQEDWGAVLRSDGKLTLHKMADLFASGSVFAGQTEFSVLGLAIR